MSYPVEVEPEGIKIRTEKMDVDKLYYCIYQGKVMLFYKDQNEILNCYEISEKEVVEEVTKSETGDIENILQRYIEKKNLNH